MPDISNYVINNIPSSGHSIYIVELEADYILQSKFMGGYRVVKTNPVQAYVWDLYALGFKQSDRPSDRNSPINYYTKRFSRTKFFPLYCGSFTDDGGQNIYAPLPNFSNLSLVNAPKYSGYNYNANFNFSPLWSTSKRNLQNTGEFIIYKASVVPLLPIMACSSVPTHKSFGPSFLTNFSISVDGKNSLGDVEINCTLAGGRVIISPDGITPFPPYTDGSVLNLKTLDPSGKIFNREPNNNYGAQYRPVNLSDCAFYFGLFTGDDAFDRFAKAVRSQYVDNRTAPVHKIVNMSLNVSQGVEFVYTYPGFSYLDKVEQFYDIVGPRFASLTSRQVSGSITLYCQTNYNFLNTNASSFTMYFGNAYFYSMKNVDWQQPKFTMNPGGGWLIEYNFVARMGEEIYFAGLGNDRVSEFFVL